jgi:hypothetical protein
MKNSPLSEIALVLVRPDHIASFIRKCGGGPFDQKLLGFLSQPSLAKWRRRAGLNELINRVETNADRVSAFHSLQ